MGSWSASCDLSGLEIAEGDECYVTLMSESKYDGWVVEVPPIKGVYDDYGSIRVLDSQPYRDLYDIPEHWSPVRDLRKSAPSPFWTHATAFDVLPQLQRDYAEAEDGTILGDWIQTVTERAEALDKAEELRQKCAGLSDSPELKDSYNTLLEFALRDVYLGCDRIYPDVVRHALKLMDAGLSRDDLNEGWRRSWMLYVGAMELRKQLVPQRKPGIGPQHGGEKALELFYATVLEVASQRVVAAAEEEAKWAAYEKETFND